MCEILIDPWFDRSVLSLVLSGTKDQPKGSPRTENLVRSERIERCDDPVHTLFYYYSGVFPFRNRGGAVYSSWKSQVDR